MNICIIYLHLGDYCVNCHSLMRFACWDLQKITKKEVRHKRDLSFYFAFWYELIIFRNCVSTFMFRFKFVHLINM